MRKIAKSADAEVSQKELQREAAQRVKFPISNLGAGSFSVRGKLLAVTADNGVIVCDVSKASLDRQQPSGRRVLPGGHGDKAVVAFHESSHDESKLLAANGCDLKLLDLDALGKHQVVRKYEGHHRPVSALCWSPSEPALFCSCGLDGCDFHLINKFIIKFFSKCVRERYGFGFFGIAASSLFQLR